ncbi:MAG TPA: PAS domain-containing protein [Usitatibacter sp.]|nr:PAS domain-containing protein [Usitatibacter sp.]
MKALGVVTAEVDTGLRYVWIDNPHPDFDPEAVVGKRDDELIPEADAEAIVALKQQILDTAQGAKRLLSFERSDGVHYYMIDGRPILGEAGQVEGIVTFGFEIPPNEARTGAGSVV